MYELCLVVLAYPNLLGTKGYVVVVVVMYPSEASFLEVLK
jgi:hypothetical protein